MFPVWDKTHKHWQYKYIYQINLSLHCLARSGRYGIQETRVHFVEDTGINNAKITGCLREEMQYGDSEWLGSRKGKVLSMGIRLWWWVSNGFQKEEKYTKGRQMTGRQCCIWLKYYLSFIVILWLSGGRRRKGLMVYLFCVF